MCQHQGRALHARDDIGYRVGLARAGHAQQSLMRQARGQAFHQQLDGLGLIARRLVSGNKFERSSFHGWSANIAQLRWRISRSNRIVVTLVVSKRALRVKPSATLAVTALAARLKSEGK